MEGNVAAPPVSEAAKQLVLIWVEWESEFSPQCLLDFYMCLGNKKKPKTIPVKLMLPGGE